MKTRISKILAAIEWLAHGAAVATVGLALTFVVWGAWRFKHGPYYAERKHPTLDETQSYLVSTINHPLKVIAACTLVCGGVAFLAIMVTLLKYLLPQSLTQRASRTLG